MDGVGVLVRTQRIVVNTQQRIVVDDRKVNVVNSWQGVAVVNAGPQGPSGIPIPSFAEGVQSFPSVTWIMDYTLGGKPAAFRFFDENGLEWEPAEITYINENRSVAQWPEPMMGSWVAS